MIQALLRSVACHPDAGGTWVALSGGIDSTVLLHAATSCRDALPGTLRAIHIDHGIHPDSAQWGEHCRTLCDALGVPLTLHRVELRPSPGESLEAVARTARYDAIAKTISPGDLVLSAHNQDDQAETLLLALLRGSGVHGLAAMPESAPLGSGRLLRPLLGHSRREIETYAGTRGLDWLDDPSNASPAMDRNYLRHRVLPLLRERWPAASRTLSRSAGHCAEAAGLIDAWCADALPGLAGSRPGTLDIQALAMLDSARLRAVLRNWTKRLGFAPPDQAHLRRIIDEVLPARADADPLVAWQGCEIRRYRRDLYAITPLPPCPADDIEWSTGALTLPDALGTLALIGPGGPAVPGRPLRVRFTVTGLGCRPPGGGHRRSLKDLFQALGVPPWLRPYCPKLFGDPGLLAIGGLSACAATEGPAPSGLRLRWTGHPWSHLGLLRSDVPLALP